MQKSYKDRLKDLLEEYGPFAIGTYLTLFALVLVAYAAIIALGLKPDSSAKTFWAVVVGAWVSAKVTQLPRIAATLVLTPFVARVFRRWRHPQRP